MLSYLRYFSLLAFFLFSCQIAAGSQLTEADVLSMLDKMEKAVAAHDADTLMTHFADDATITLDMPTEMGGKVHLTVDDFKKNLKQAWSMPAQFTYKVENKQVNVHPNGQTATATDTSFETIKMNGMLLAATRTQQHIEIRSVAGKPTITRLYGKVTF